MLANGATLTVKVDGAVKALAGLKEIPELGADPELVENTCLTDQTKKYEMGIGDLGNVAYVFKYDNSSEDTAYRILRGLDSSQSYEFTETLKDGTKSVFSAQPSVKRGGGGVNGVLDFTLSLAVTSEIAITDPA